MERRTARHLALRWKPAYDDAWLTIRRVLITSSASSRAGCGMTPRKEKGPPTSETNGARRYSFDNTRLGRGWNDARQLVICGIGQSAISSLGPLATTDHHEHVQVHELTGGRSNARPNDRFNNRHSDLPGYCKPLIRDATALQQLGRGLHRSRKDRRPSRSAFRPVRIRQQAVAGEPSDHRANPLLS